MTRQSIKTCVFVSLLAAAPLFAAAPATFKVSGFAFTRPATWEWVQTSSSMRKAQLKVTDAKSNAGAEVIFFYFGPGQGGDVQANVDRWLGQFDEPRDKINARTETVTVGKHKVTYVEAEGTYHSGMPGMTQASLPGYGLAGAIIEDQAGNVFVRMTGPKDLVKASLAEFKKMVESGLK